jgi:putative Mg2+ transporter-C (MgtC) family protein
MMNSFLHDALSGYWGAAEIATNLIIFLNLFGALALGLVVGYERSYHGRAAGMRTYGLVCMASAALTVLAGYPTFWYGGQVVSFVGADPTRIIQGIVTGIGFLGAGVIMREGMNISGLTTAASLWASSAIGIMVGVGFYPAAILLALLSAVCMMWVSRLENWLPSRQAVAVVIQFKKDFVPSETRLRERALTHGYEIASGSLSINFKDGMPEWKFVAIALGKGKGAPMTDLAEELTDSDGVENFFLSHARN